MLSWSFLPLFGSWLVISALVTVAAVRIAGDGADGDARLEPEVTLVIAGSGAAVGGFLGLGSLVAASLRAMTGAASGSALATAAAGMLLGAAGATGLALVVVWLRAD